MSDGLRCERFWVDREVLTHAAAPLAPAVSLVMAVPFATEPDTVSRAIEALTAQTRRDFQLIVVDDGCARRTHQRLRELATNEPRITLVLHRAACGLLAVRLNEGLAEAQGQSIAYPDCSSPWAAHQLEALVAELGRVAPATTDECVQRAPRPWATDPIALLGGQPMPLSSILHWRHVLRDTGGFDPHIVARQTYERDFLVRLAQTGPFAHVAGDPPPAPPSRASAAASIPGGLLARRRFAIDRSSALALDAVGTLAVDALDWIGDDAERDRVYHRHVAPFLAVFNDALGEERRPLALPLLPRPRTVAVTKTDFSTSVDVTLTNFCRVLPPARFQTAFVAERELPQLALDEASTLVLYRTLSSASSQALADARRSGRTTLYFMDDNMLQFGTGYLAEEHGYLAPGSPAHDEIKRQLAQVDLVVTYSEHLAGQCREIAPRVVQLETNILDRYIRDSAIAPRAGGERLRFAVLSGKARARELKRLWPTIAEFASRRADEIEFHFWGMDPAEFGTLACPVFFRPFENTLYSYLDALLRTRFHFVVCPLDDDHETKLVKSPVKYLEITAAGAVGVYSNAAAYRVVHDQVTGIKVDDDWPAALEACCALSDEQRRTMHAAAKEEILEQFTTESQATRFLTAFEAADLHRKLGADTSGSRRNPTIGYFAHESLLGGATLHLLSHARIAKRWGFTPCFFVREKEPAAEFLEIVKREGLALETNVEFVVSGRPRQIDDADQARASAIAARLSARNVALIHSVTVIEEVALAASKLGLPLVRSLHAYPETPPAFAPVPVAQELKSFGGDAIHSSSVRYARVWAAALGAPAYCLRAPIAAAHFQRFATRASRPWPREPHFLISGTLQRRKRQLTAIEAISILKLRGLAARLTCLGYAHLDPAYVQECRDAIASLSLSAVVSIDGFDSAPLDRYGSVDALLCASVHESMPQSILKSMALGVPVVTTDVGGVCEILEDGYSGIVAQGHDAHALADAMERLLRLPDEERSAMVRRAHTTASMVCREDAVALGLMRIYSEAADRAAARRDQQGRLV